MTLNQHKIKNYVIIASLKSETMGILINRIPDSHLLISSLPGSALRMLVESLGKPRDVNKHSQSLGILGQVWYLIVSIPDLCNLTYFDIKRHSPSILYFYTPVYSILFYVV